MKNKLLSALFIIGAFLAFGINAHSQTVFWTETFNNGCTCCCLASGVNTGNGAWAIDNTGGCNDTYANEWFVSCAENGNAVGACGSGCGAIPTLHIGANDGIFLDIGASYDAGGLGGCGNGGTYTYTRAVSPLISTAGKSGISISFNYLMFGQAGIDYGWVDYSTNGGVSWTNLVNPAQTLCCGGACNSFRQGKWANYTSGVLPAGANNIANFRLRFGWTNNDDGLGDDPSYAISKLQLRYTVLLPVELLDFTAQYSEENNAVDLTWSTATETNNSYFTIERSADGLNFNTVTTVKGAGNSSTTKNYTAVDPSPYNGTSYYRLEQTDYDGHSVDYNPVAVKVINSNLISVYPNPAGSLLNVTYYSASRGTSSTLYIVDYTGRCLGVHALLSANEGMNTYRLNTSQLAAGMYILKIETPDGRSIFSRFAKQ